MPRAQEISVDLLVTGSGAGNDFERRHPFQFALPEGNAAANDHGAYARPHIQEQLAGRLGRQPVIPVQDIIPLQLRHLARAWWNDYEKFRLHRIPSCQKAPTAATTKAWPTW